MNSQHSDDLGEYRRALARWSLAAGFWLGFWWFFTVGAIVASTLSAASPSFLLKEHSHVREWYGEVIAWFAVVAVSITGLVRPWRFHRGYQVAAYKLQIALYRAEMTPSAAPVHREFVLGINRILDAGKELDESDGLREAKKTEDGSEEAPTKD